ncbi:hypothetical protein K450DRAFT_236359 [Umbelopsis ramanniana AG]|uniref:Uncharacterized protein n=1 Tax=Umbelopsis ramanniana AG TaxID=1314678 RepID=A0AAD5EAW0_UMBRA|nr:uncharacterized protein K450DRAFT_236359 [Umbelopsis ramanniana AG]KAI8580588.1 hypothetical protein K450DRAFT_236359 [Umbelopsis ramanniana AG]
MLRNSLVKHESYTKPQTPGSWIKIKERVVKFYQPLVLKKLKEEGMISISQIYRYTW